MNSVKSRAPMRVSFAGGGSDIPAFYHKFGGAVVNAAINVYAYTEINLNAENKVVFDAKDLGQVDKFDLDDIAPDSEATSKTLLLHGSVYRWMMQKYNNGEPLPLSVSSFCEAPIGSGLGGSSALCVSLVKAFVEFFKAPVDDYELFEIAYHIERVICSINGGKQDQVASAFGGFNYTRFERDESVVVTRLRLRNWIINELESCSLLYFSGLHRDSSPRIKEQIKKLNGSESDRENDLLCFMRDQSTEIKQHLIEGRFTKLYQAVNDGFEAKKKFDPTGVTTELRDILETARSFGAFASRVCGAGGGGYVLIFAPMVSRLKISETLTGKFGGYVTPFKFTSSGCHSWTTG